MTEKEFFQDNAKILKQESAKIENARTREEKASDALDELLPKLESTVEAFGECSDELTMETVVESMVQDGPMGEIGRKIIKYQAKEKAI